MRFAPLLAACFLLASPLLADSGDAIYLASSTSPVLLDAAAKRTLLINAASSVIPGFVVADFEGYGCKRYRLKKAFATLGQWVCQGQKRQANLTDAQRLAAVVGGQFIGGDAVYVPGSVMNNESAHGAFTLSVLGKQLSELGSFRCYRNGGSPQCDYVELTSASPASWFSLYQAGGVVGTVGVAP